MKTLAAVLVETGRPLELATLELPPLRSGQVLVKLAYSGVCGSQLLEARGHRGLDAYLPHCLGHEATGHVVEVGADVNSVCEGDPVILSWMKGAGCDVPGTTYRWGERTVNAGGVTTFQQYSVVSENRVTTLPAGVPLTGGALVGCAMATGMGAVWNTGAAEKGQSLAVFGTGGIGLFAIAAAAEAQCTPVIAVDPNPQRRELAAVFGATHSLEPQNCLDRIRETVRGGIDLAIEASGHPAVMATALQAVRPRGGRVVVVGNARKGSMLELDPAELNQGKRLLGTWGGDNQPEEHFPRYCQLLVSGKFDVSCLIPRIYDLSEINQALDDLEAGLVPRPLVHCAAE